MKASPPLILAILFLYTTPDSGAQAPIVRFALSEMTVSQTRGTASIPVLIENSGNVPSYLSIGWTTHPGTAVDHVHYGRKDPYAWSETHGWINVYPNQSRSSITIPIQYAASVVDRTFSVELSSVTNVYSFGVGAGLGDPTVTVVTIANLREYVALQRRKLATVNRELRKARKIKNPTTRNRKMASLNRQKTALLKRIRP